MDRKKKIVLIIPIVVTVVLMVIFLWNTNLERENDSDPTITRAHENTVNLNRLGELPDESLNLIFEPSEFVEELGSIGVRIVGSEVDSITLGTPQDTINVVVVNESLVDENLILKIFYNYEEVQFQISGSDRYITEYLFLAPSGYDLTIPIQLDGDLEVNDTINKLTVGIFWNPEYYIAILDFHSDKFNDITLFPGMVLNYEINYGILGELILPVAATVPDALLDDLPFHSLEVNDDLELEWGVEAVVSSPQPWQVWAGEEVEMAFFTNPHGIILEEIEDYLIIAMLDWHQIPINGKPYLLVNSIGTGQQGVFTITAPDEPGLYDFVAFMVLNPTRQRYIYTNYFPLEISTRFTLEVLE